MVVHAFRVRDDLQIVSQSWHSHPLDDANDAGQPCPVPSVVLLDTGWLLCGMIINSPLFDGVRLTMDRQLMKTNIKIPKQDWNRFDFYARFVSTLRLGPDGSNSSDPKWQHAVAVTAERALCVLFQYHPNASTTGFPRNANNAHPVFPALRYISCTVEQPKVSTIALLALVGTRLERIDILRAEHFGNTTKKQDKKQLPPKLRSVDLQRHCADLVSKALPTLHDTLHTLDLRGIELTVENIRAIATLPHLRTLALCLSEWDFASKPSSSSSRHELTAAQMAKHFPDLWSLTLCGPDEPDIWAAAEKKKPESVVMCTALLDAFRAKSLKSLTLHDVPVVGADEIRAFAAVLADLKPADLTELHCDMTVHHAIGSDSEVKCNDFEPLLQLSHLKLLKLLFDPQDEDEFNLFGSKHP